MRLMRTPRTVDIDITTKCNLRCRYCYHFSGPGDVNDLPTEKWLAFFEELGRAAVMNVALAGGEPFTRKDLPELLNGIVKNRMRFSILSNGTLIDDSMASFIAGTGRCDGVQISIDGADAETHDSCRGKGSFYKAVRGIKCLQRHDVTVNIRVTIHRYNVNKLAEVAAFLLEELDLPSFSTNAASYLGLCRDNMTSVGLSVADRNQAMRTLTSLNRKYNNRITANAGPLAEAIIWSEMEKARASDDPILFNSGRLTGCGCVTHTVAVRADGVIVPCTMLSHIELGRIGRDDLQEIWQSHPLMEQRRRRAEIELSTFGYCADCQYCNYCTGNCPGLAYSLTGQADQPSPDACLRDFLKMGGQLPQTL